MTDDKRDVVARPELQRITIEIRQIVPFNEALPRCTARTQDGMQCMFSARYMQNDNAICGQHLGRPSTVFVKPKRKW
jgi:hypothetical protein